MKIAICDDEQEFINQIATCLSRQTEDVPECFLSPLNLLEKYEHGERYDLLFLDVQMEPMDGITLAKEIRKFDDSVSIIFLTSYLEFAPLGYEVNALRYLLKPITEEALSKALQAIPKENPGKQKILIKTPEGNFFIQADDIEYLEISDKETTIHCTDETIVIRKGLSELEEALSGKIFFRIHRKYMVNLSHVQEFDEKHLSLNCGKTLPVGRRRSNDFLDAIDQFISGD